MRTALTEEISSVAYHRVSLVAAIFEARHWQGPARISRRVCSHSALKLTSHGPNIEIGISLFAFVAIWLSMLLNKGMNGSHYGMSISLYCDMCSTIRTTLCQSSLSLFVAPFTLLAYGEDALVPWVSSTKIGSGAWADCCLAGIMAGVDQVELCKMCMAGCFKVPKGSEWVEVMSALKCESGDAFRLRSA